MSNRKKAILLTFCVCLLLLAVGITFPFAKNYLMDLGLIYFSEKEVISFFEKNKDDLKIAADYVLNRCTFYDENIATQELDKKYKSGEVIEYIDIYSGKGGVYSCSIFNKITSNKNSNLLEKIEPYDISSQIEPSFNKIINKGYVAIVSTGETRNKSTHIDFILKSYGFFEEQRIVYFKEKEHDFEFQFGYRVVPLSEEGWYYLEMSDAAHR